MRRRPAIRDIVCRAGVSVGTVSNILNGQKYPASQTCDRVLQAASELHFTPNALIRSLQRGCTRIELLVAIAMIAILEVILLPVFAQARKKARQTSCLSSTRQTALAVGMAE